MKINRMSTEKTAPDWVFNSKASDFFEKEAINTNEAKRLSSMPSNISDDELVLERDRIEKCASSKTPYVYNANWPANVKAELKEYASVCGMDMSKFRAVEPSSIPVVKEASDEKMIKTASTNITLDPFKIDDKIANSYQKTKWQPELKGQAKLDLKPTMGGIVPIRGGEDYFANSEPKVAKGQNSISDPNAIGKLADSQEEDTGARLKRENEEKQEAKKIAHEEWQQAKIDAMEQKNILPNRHVFPTECLNAQPGIRGNVFDFDSVPEQTDGEKIAEANDQRKKSIRGEEKERHQFSTEKAPVRSISEDFGEELKKHLGQID